MRRSIKVAGCVGPCAALDKKMLPGSVADVSIGSGGTTVGRCRLTLSNLR